MTVNKITEAIIYESPDGGETVYIRESGSAMRQLYSESPQVKSIRSQIQEDQLWHEIRLAAKTNSAINDILEQAIILYKLSKS
jgi:hypothetical protein